MDNYTSEDVVLLSTCLVDPEFQIGLWYAQQRQLALGLNVDDVLLTERYTTELRDPYLGGAAILLEHAECNGDHSETNFSRIVLEERDPETYLVKDLLLEREELLVKEFLKNPDFDLVAWYRVAFSTQLLESDYDLASVGESSEYDMLSNESELTESLDDESDEPPELRDTDSDSDPETEVETEIAYAYPVGQAWETFEDRMNAIVQTFRSWILFEKSPQFCNDPYPGDEREMDESRRHHNRFDLCSVLDEDYSISDAYYREITILPVALLRDPTFEITTWYSWQRVAALEYQGWKTRPLHQVPVGETIVVGISQYFSEISSELPEFDDYEIFRITDFPGPETYFISWTGVHDAQGCLTIPETSLLNVHFNLAGWIMKRKLKSAVRENNFANGLTEVATYGYFYILYEGEISDKEIELLRVLREVEDLCYIHATSQTLQLTFRSLR
ncbi:hypothetical protein DFH07DRAFT_966653 [Mycena maculata]|uniref:Uncharacterized protein n=1 Tax=Mycena maculata TaxID=230809 RepID=A0AAD7I7R3_9AGAR|nr:hypothetical protein DFH07DRAFT_966653 [Mycena maculata]